MGSRSEKSRFPQSSNFERVNQISLCQDMAASCHGLLDDSAIVKKRVDDSRWHFLESSTSGWEILPEPMLMERALVASRLSHKLAGPPVRTHRLQPVGFGLPRSATAPRTIPRPKDWISHRGWLRWVWIKEKTVGSCKAIKPTS